VPTVLLSAQVISGSYTLAANGYGTMTFNEDVSDPGFGDIVTVGVYAVDPTINILDPNNTTDTASAGGALLAEMDTNLAGTGALIPQTDTTATDSTGNYAFGATGLLTTPASFDFLGEANIAAAAFSGTGALSDPFGVFTAGGEFNTVTFAATVTPDLVNAGRSTFSPLTLTSTAFGSDDVTLDYTIYQANGAQLFMVEMDDDVESHGAIEQNTLTASAAARPDRTTRNTNPERQAVNYKWWHGRFARSCHHDPCVLAQITYRREGCPIPRFSAEWEVL
jgi:hypothetical protein